MAHVWKSSQGADGARINWDEFDDAWDDSTDEERVWKRVWKKDGGNGGSASFYGVGLLGQPMRSDHLFSGTAYLPPPQRA